MEFVKKIILIILLLPILSNCTQYSAMVGPSVTFAQSGSVLQATSSLTSSLAINKAKNNDFVSAAPNPLRVAMKSKKGGTGIFWKKAIRKYIMDENIKC